MNKKDQYIKELWSHKDTSEIILVLYSLIENSDISDRDKKSTYAVLKGIITYTDRGDRLMEHHRKYLYDTWTICWSAQKDNSVKEEIKGWLLERSV